MITIMVLSWLSSVSAWTLCELRDVSSPVLRGVFGANVLFHPVMIAVIVRRLLPMRIVDLICLLFATGLCAACMALRLYYPAWGGRIDIQPLYLWIPVIYVFAFTLASHDKSLRISLAILAVFVAISLPYLVGPSDQRPLANFTIQMHMVSAVLIAALYFFASYQHRFDVARMTVDELARLANTDPLTQVANRRRMAEVLEAELLRHGRYGSALSIVLIDIDHFKDVNDRDGHVAGDRVLVALAARLGEALREVDTLGRWGGEEFLVILPETGFDETLGKAEAIRRHVAAAPLAGDRTVTISGGVASARADDTATSLLERADAALYAAKRAGRNRVDGTPGPSKADRARQAVAVPSAGA